jgi:hypothetical protein
MPGAFYKGLQAAGLQAEVKGWRTALVIFVILSEAKDLMAIASGMLVARP